MQTLTLSNLALFDWDVKWGTLSFGAVDKVDPQLTLKLKAKQVGSAGDVALGHWIIGLEGKIRVEQREISHTIFNTLIPWNQGSSTAAIPLNPSTANGDLYDYAQTLTLHPSHLATNVTNLDLVLNKAVPMTPPNMTADGVADVKNIVDFIFYPDRSSLPNKVYGTFGT